MSTPLVWLGFVLAKQNNLRIRDIDAITDIDGRPTIQLYVRGKTGTRTVQPHIELGPILQAMIARRGEIQPNDLLFVMPDGGKIITLIDQFNTFLKYVGLTHTNEGTKYTLYSLRHYYAVRSLGRADIYSVAQNMGTSVQMIEQYYGKHGISPERARRLAGEVGDAQRAQDPVKKRKKLGPRSISKAVYLVASFLQWSAVRRQRTAQIEERRAWVAYFLDRDYRRFTEADVTVIDKQALVLDPATAKRFANENGLLNWFDDNKQLIDEALKSPRR